MRRAAILCPGRGSYTDASLGSLPADHEWVHEADRQRAELELEPLTELDAAERFSPTRHLRAANAAALIYVKSMLDAADAFERFDVVCVGGNSMGWYTALAVAGVLDFADGFRLVQEMSLLQESGAPGGQVLYPIVDDAWQPHPERATAVREALAARPTELFPSIRLGGYRVLAGTNEGVAYLLESLPKAKLGKTIFPLRLAQHGPYHTPLAASVSVAARRSLADLRFRRPRTPLVDGRGVRFSPWSADLGALHDYTLGAQVEQPYDFTASVRVALREFAPERLVLPGPGNSLGGVCGQVLAAEGWRGVASRDDFAAVQESDSPIVVSMGG